MQTSELQFFIVAVSAFAGALGGTAGLGWWLATRFNNVYMRIAATEKLLTTKIDDHEKLDVERFNQQGLAIMRLEMKAGTIGPDGTPLYGI